MPCTLSYLAGRFKQVKGLDFLETKDIFLHFEYRE